MEFIHGDIRTLTFDRTFDIIYLDPPYNTGVNFGEFDDRWSDGEYANLIYKVLANVKKFTHPKSVVICHCDWHANYVIRDAMRIIYGSDNFSNEIYVKRSPKNFGNVKRRLTINLESLLVTWCSDLGEIAQVPTKPIEGAEERWCGLTAGGAGGPMKFGDTYIHPPRGRHFMWSQEHIIEEWNNGNIKLNNRGTPVYRCTTDTQYIGTDWTDIPAYAANPTYPTQKHPDLMRRIIQTYGGSSVLDGFMGSGVMADVCAQYGIDYVGCDINENAVEEVRKRHTKPTVNLTAV